MTKKTKIAKAETSSESKLLDDIAKKYGNVIKKGDALLEERKDYKILKVSPIIDVALGGGIKEGSWVMLSGAAKSGKEQPYSSLVYTPSGQKTMGELQLNDIICTPYGKTSKIIGIYEQGVKDVFKITFNDGSEAECGLDHLWKVCENNKSGKRKWITLSLKDILYQGIKSSDRNKWRIPITQEVDFNKKELTIDPYILGCLIGDGGLTNKTPIITTSDEEILNKFYDYCLQNNLELKHISRYDYRIKSNNKHLPNNLTIKLKDLGLMGKDSHSKFIPEIYKINCIEYRYKILQGLMDTDGCCYEYGAEYTTVSYQLALDIKFLLESLGFLCKIKKRQTKCNDKSFDSYRLSISGNDLSKIFSLNRKKSIFKKRKKRELTRTIKRIEKVRQENSRCIMLDSDDHLYLTNNFVVTHNTTLAMQIAKNGQEEGRPIIYINAEGRLKEMNFEVEGLDPQGMQIITSEGPPLSAEVFLDITLKLLSAKENEGAICIIDSISSLIPARDLESEISGERRPGLPKILGDFVKKLGQIVPNQKSIVVMITHMITNTSGYGKAYMADGGVKIGYQADTRMEVKSISPWVQDDQQVGQAVNWKVLCSSIGPPGAECQSWIRYGNGIDKVQEVVMMGQEAGLITQAGAWFTCNFLLTKPEIVLRLNEDIKINDSGNYETPDDAALALKACKFQGGEALYNFVKSNKDVYEALVEAIEMMLC
jgi:RecA/RadA recombinase